MRKFFTIVLAASMLLLWTNTSAQTWTAGGGFSLFSLSGADSDKVMNGSVPGFYFGVNYDYAFSAIEGLTVEPGVYIMHYGKDRTMPFTTGSKAYRANFIRVPLNIKYSVPFDSNISVSAFTGPRFDLGIGGNMFSKGETYIGLKGLDAQWGFGVAATIVDAVALRAGYDVGLTKCIKNKTKHSDWGENMKVHRNTVFIGIGFAF